MRLSYCSVYLDPRTLTLTFLADLKQELFMNWTKKCISLILIQNCFKKVLSHLTTVTKTSQMLSSGKIKLGGKLDMKSNPVANTITLKHVTS